MGGCDCKVSFLIKFWPKFPILKPILNSRYNCSFEDKVRNAQKAGFDAVIVFNKKSDELEIMSANDDSDIFIPSLFVGQTTGSLILTNYQYFEGFALVLNDDLPFNINTHLIIPFCIVVGLCLVVMVSAHLFQRF